MCQNPYYTISLVRNIKLRICIMRRFCVCSYISIAR